MSDGILTITGFARFERLLRGYNDAMAKITELEAKNRKMAAEANKQEHAPGLRGEQLGQ